MVDLLASSCSHTETVKTGGGDISVLSVKKFDPAVKYFEFGKVINIVGGGGPLPSNQTSFGCLRRVARTSSFVLWGWKKF